MFKLNLKKSIILLCGAIGIYAVSALLYILILPQSTPTAYAARPQIMMTQPSVNNIAIGHPGTKVQIVGTGFNTLIPLTVQLFTTTSNTAGKCQLGDPSLNPFLTNPTVTTQDGTFNVTTTWPGNAAGAGVQYFICAIAPIGRAISSNSFTVAQPVAITIAPNNVVQGGTVNISGSNWLPPQQLNVSIGRADANTPTIVSNTVTPDANGNFSTMLTIPTNAQPMAYTVRVNAPGENTPAMTQVQDNAVTVTQAATPTPTPTAAPSPTPSPTTSPAATPTPTSGSGTGGDTGTGSGGINTNTFLLFAMGGLGILLVIVGVILFILYSRGA